MGVNIDIATKQIAPLAEIASFIMTLHLKCFIGTPVIIQQINRKVACGRVMKVSLINSY